MRTAEHSGSGGEGQQGTCDHRESEELGSFHNVIVRVYNARLVFFVLIFFGLLAASGPAAFGSQSISQTLCLQQQTRKPANEPSRIHC